MGEILLFKVDKDFNNSGTRFKKNDRIVVNDKTIILIPFDIDQAVLLNYSDELFGKIYLKSTKIELL